MVRFLQFVFLFYCVQLFSQQGFYLQGKVLGNNKELISVHIFNSNTKKGTLTDKNGEFTIYVNVQDTLVFSALPFKKKQIQISKNMAISKSIEVSLYEDVVELTKVNIKSHQLSGSLFIDANNVPKNLNIPSIKIKIDKKELNLNAIPMYNDVKDRGLEEAFTQYNMMDLKAIAKMIFNPIKRKHKKNKEIKKFKQNIPYIFRNEIGDTFFIKDLHIPKPNIDNFLEENCRTLDFIELYNANKKIECIEYLIEKSKTSIYVSK